MKGIHNWSIRTRLLVAFLGVLIPYLTLAGIGAVGLQSLWRSVRVVQDQALTKLEGTADLQVSVVQLVMPANDYLITGDPTEREKFERHLGRVFSTLARVGVWVFGNPDAVALLDLVKIQVSQMDALSREILALSNPRENRAAHAKMRALDRAADEAAEALDQIHEIAHHEVEEVAGHTLKMFWRVMGAGLVAIILSVAGGLGLALVFSAWLGRPILEIARKSRRMAEGDLTQRVGVRAGGELGEAARAFNEMAERLEASAAENSRLLGAREEAKRVLEQLNTVGTSLHASKEITERLRIFLRGVREVVGFDRLNVLLLSLDKSALELVVSGDGEILTNPMRIPLDSAGPYAEAIRSRRPLLIQGKKDLQALPPLDEALSHLPIFRSTRFVIVPLVVGDQVVGVASADNKLSRRPISPASAEQLQLFCQQLAVAIDNSRLYERAERDRHSFEVLYDVSRHLAAVHDTDQILSLIVKEAARLLGAEAAGLRLLEGKDLVLKARTESAAAFVSRVRLKVGESLSGLVVTTGKPVASEDLAHDTRYDPIHRRGALEHGFHGFLGAPLLSRGCAIGTLNIYTKSHRRFTPEEISLISAFADQASLAIEKARLLHEAEAREKEATRLYEVTNEMASSLDASRILDMIAAKTAELLGSDASGIFANGELTLHRGHSLEDKAVRAGAVALGNAIAWRAFKERCLVWTRDCLSDPALGPVALPPAGGKVLRACIAAPLISRGEACGVLLAYFFEPRDFAPGEVRLFSTLAHHAATALDNSRLYEAVSAQAEALSEKNKHLSFLHRQVAVALTSSLSLNDVLNQIMSRGISVSGAKATCIAFYDEPSGLFKEWLTQGLSDHFVENMSFRPGGLADETFISRAHVLSNDRPETKHKLSRLAREEGIRAFICLPLMGHERELGVIYFYRDDRDTFTPDEIELLTTFAHLAAGAIDNSRLFEEAQNQRTRLTQIFDSASDAIISADSGGRIIAWNKGAQAIFGWSEKEVWCEPLTRLIPERYKEAHQRGVERVSSGGEPRIVGTTAEMHGLRKDGGEFPAELSLTSWKTREGTFYTAIIRDITERKRMEQMKSDFVSFATHQLRTPLAGIKWLLELASQEPDLPEGARSYIQDTRDSAERLIGLVNDLLDISRIENGKLAVALKETDLHEMTSSVLDEVKTLVEEKGHQLSFAGDGEVPPVWADPQLLRQVVLNLVSNAIKYTPPGGKMEVWMEREDSSVLWAIRDNGIGIPKGAQGRLFEKFYRADNAQTIHTEGTGLGLYLARLIVERLGGRIWCESEEGEGTTFLLKLPLSE